MANIKNSKPLYIVLSVLIAIVLWLYVDNVENPDTEIPINNIPVTLVGEKDVLADRGLMVTEGMDTTVGLKLQGKRSTLSKLDRENIKIVVDLTKVTTVGSKNMAYEIVFPDNVMAGSISILSRSSYYIDVVIDKLAVKTVEVHGEFDGNVADGFVADEFIFSPKTVEISGQAEFVSQVSYALVSLSQSNINETVSAQKSYTLVGFDGEEITAKDLRKNPEMIQVTLPIVVVKDVPLELLFIETPGSTTNDITYSIEPKSISISGEAEDIAGLNSITIATIDLSKILESSDLLYNIPLSTGIKNLSGVTQATVHITLSGLPTQTFDATTIELINIPARYQASLVTQSVPVAIRGNQNTLDLILPQNIRLVADLKEINATGRYTVSAKAYLDGYDDAGAVGEYKVVVSIDR